MFLQVLEDAESLEAAGIPDRSCLFEIWRAPESKAAVAEANADTLETVQESSKNYGSHADALHARVRHYQPKRPDNDYTVGSILPQTSLFFL